MSGRRALAAAACSLVVLAAPSAAGAHAALLTATPDSGGTLGAAPQTLELVFSENVVQRYAQVSVLGAHGENLAGVPRVSGSVVAVPVRPARVGSYTVRWRMVSSDDGHAAAGAYSFGVRAKPQPPAAVKGLTVPVAPQLLAWLEFVGVVLVGGLLTVRALVLAPARTVLGDGPAPDGNLAIGIAVAGAVIALHAGTLAFLVGAYPVIGGGFAAFEHAAIEPIRAGTHAGQAWTVTTFAWLGVLALLVAAWVTPRRREPLLAYAGVSALAIAFGLSWASHPASRGALALVADYAHLVAGALWVGGLVALVSLARATSSLPPATREAFTRRSVLRFSALAAPTVALVGAAGLYLVLRELPTPSALVSSHYGVTLLAKTGVALGALALGGYHRRFVVPRLTAGAPVATLRGTLAIELGVLLGVLALAAILGQTAPPAGG
jgi:copper transport protein